MKGWWGREARYIPLSLHGMMIVDLFIWYVTGYGGMAGCPFWDNDSAPTASSRGCILTFLNLLFIS